MKNYTLSWVVGVGDQAKGGIKNCLLGKMLNFI